MPAEDRALGGFPGGAEDYTRSTSICVSSAHSGVQEPALPKDARHGHWCEEGGRRGRAEARAAGPRGGAGVLDYGASPG